MSVKPVVQDVMKLIPRLSHSERLEVMKRLKALDSLEGKSSVVEEDPGDDWLLFGIISVIRERGLSLSIPPRVGMVKLREFKTYNSVSPRIREGLQKAVGTINKTELHSLGIVVARALAAHLAKFTPVSFRTMLRFVGQAPDAIEKAFPGYIQAGMLRMVIQRQGKVGTVPIASVPAENQGPAAT